ncbi:MAG: DUF4065 domain-containing protein [Bacilli bacterium]|nr:DUF4065 domain-containing protein [Bacilli bacterium]
MTHKKLQKLLYFSFGIYLAKYNDKIDDIHDFLFENNFEAWVHGPVDPNVYEIFKNNGINLLFIEKPEKIEFDEKAQLALNETMKIYGMKSADELENISHSQSPWKNARIGLLPIEPSSNKLDDKDIYLTFKEII